MSEREIPIADSVAGLTKAQLGVLHQVATHGEKVYNGRMRRTIEVLEARGLVEVDWDAVLVTKGGGSQMLWRIRVRLAQIDSSGAQS